MKTVLCVVGARPNFIKIAPIMHALAASERLSSCLIHTGQHYDIAMNDVFFEELNIPRPDLSLGVGSNSHAIQTAQVMIALDPILAERQPDMMVVVGDVNSTLAAALVASKCKVPIAHVEAGLRSFDRDMPEEINRVLTDQVSDLLFTSERNAQANLEAEGIDPKRVCFVGNVMIDSLLANLRHAVPAGKTLRAAEGGSSVDERGFVLLTLHRPSNVDDPATLRGLLDVMVSLAADCPIAFPVHPRTRKAIFDAGLDDRLQAPGMIVMEPVSYFAMLGLMREARLVLTDSGGIQEETTGLGVPCLTLRDSTERPITVIAGTNDVVGMDPTVVLDKARRVLASDHKGGRIPELWDGSTAKRIIAELERALS